jgi:hypothetical protein
MARRTIEDQTPRNFAGRLPGPTGSSAADDRGTDSEGMSKRGGSARPNDGFVEDQTAKKCRRPAARPLRAERDGFVADQTAKKLRRAIRDESTT